MPRQPSQSPLICRSSQRPMLSTPWFIMRCMIDTKRWQRRSIPQCECRQGRLQHAIHRWLSHQKGLAEALPHWQKPGKTLVADCTGTLLAARTGLSKGRNANTLHLAANVLRQYGVNVINARLVDDGNLITSV